MDCLVDLELTVSKEKEATPVIEEFLEMPLKEHLVLQDLSVQLEKKVEMPILEGLDDTKNVLENEFSVVKN